MDQSNLPQDKTWFTLKEACALKGLSYNTALNRKELRPNHGIPDGTIGGKKVWHRGTILKWIEKTDLELLGESGGKR